MSRRVYTVHVTVRSPFIFQGLDVAAHGFDASAHRDELGRLIIPGDHLRGHLRHALAALTGGVTSIECTALFGTESPKGMNDAPARGGLLIGDLHDDGGPRQIAVYPRVALDDATGAAAEGAVQQIELAAPIGEEVCFAGRLVLRPMQGLSASAAEDLLRTALCMIPAMGAAKSAGFGEVVPDRCGLAPLVDPPGRAFPVAAGRWQVTVRFDRPLLVNAERLDNNIFKGSTVVPGGAVKGTLAAAIDDAGGAALLDDAFAALRISHAFPLADGTRADRAIPDAMVASHAVPVFDEGGDLLAQLSKHGAPAFPGDWKDDVFDAARSQLGRPRFAERFLSRGRVAIDSTGVASDGQLFVVMPIATAGTRWRFTLDSTGAPDALRAAIAAQFEAGLDGVGRTAARMVVVEEVIAAPPAPAIAADEVLLLLETPAALTDPTDGSILFDQYRCYFRAVADAELLECWARQRMAGHYLSVRHRAFGNQLYQPFELTEAGAVFRLRLRDRERLRALLVAGLRPLPFRTPAMTWRNCPFVAENGYGEISVLSGGAAA